MHRLVAAASRVLAAVCVVGVLGACAAGPATLSRAEHAARLPALEAEAAQRPQDAEAQRELGEALVQTGAYARGREALERARRLAPGDPETAYFLGAALEGLGRPDEALRAYRGVSARTDPFSRRARGRARWLRREMLTREIAALVAAEDSIGTGDVTPAVAVFPLHYGGSTPAYAPLGRGLSEMIAVDLASVEGVRVVERVRLQVLLDELAMAEGGAFDPASAPRVGRLLRSGRVVGGGIDVRDERLETDVALWDWTVEAAPELEAAEGALADLFRLEKEIVFRLLGRLGVDLPEAERERLRELPTQNLQAFLAYSRALLEEDAGRYGAAAALHRQALQIDPGFAEAAEAAETAEAAEAQGGPVETALATPLLAPARLEAVGVIQTRIARLHAEVGGQTAPTEEARGAAAEVLPPAPATLPDPPAPPSSGGN